MEQPHFHFGFHPEHGFVATATMRTPPHLAGWYLTREQFEPVPGTPGLYRLTSPEHDGNRRVRQAVTDLRKHQFTVHADLALDPALSPAPRQPAAPSEFSEHRNRRAQAASTRTSQQQRAPTAVQPRAASLPPLPQYTPTIGAPQHEHRHR